MKYVICLSVFVFTMFPQLFAGCSPLLLDLGRDGFHLGGETQPVWFDILNTGNPLLIQWVRPGENEAFLAVDFNRNGLVDDGGELFGNGSPLLLEANRRAPNGFVALAQYDRPTLGGNDDGFISSEDAIWQDLRLWLDQNADGICQAEEMLVPEEYGVGLLETIPVELDRRDAHGNHLKFMAKAYKHKRKSSKPMLMIDVFFKRQ